MKERVITDVIHDSDSRTRPVPGPGAGPTLGIAVIVLVVVLVDAVPLLIASDRNPGSWAGLLVETAMSTYGLVWNVVLAALLVLLSPVLRRLTGAKSLAPFLVTAVAMPLLGFVVDAAALRAGRSH